MAPEIENMPLQDLVAPLADVFSNKLVDESFRITTREMTSKLISNVIKSVLPDLKFDDLNKQKDNSAAVAVVETSSPEIYDGGENKVYFKGINEGERKSEPGYTETPTKDGGKLIQANDADGRVAYKIVFDKNGKVVSTQKHLATEKGQESEYTTKDGKHWVSKQGYKWNGTVEFVNGKLIEIRDTGTKTVTSSDGSYTMETKAGKRTTGTKDGTVVETPVEEDGKDVGKKVVARDKWC